MKNTLFLFLSFLFFQAYSQNKAVVTSVNSGKELPKIYFQYKTITVQSDLNGNLLEENKQALYTAMKEQVGRVEKPEEFSQLKEELTNVSQLKTVSEILNYYGNLGFEMVDVVSYSRERTYELTFYFKKQLLR